MASWRARLIATALPLTAALQGSAGSRFRCRTSGVSAIVSSIRDSSDKGFGTAGRRGVEPSPSLRMFGNAHHRRCARRALLVRRRRNQRSGERCADRGRFDSAGDGVIERVPAWIARHFNVSTSRRARSAGVSALVAPQAMGWPIGESRRTRHCRFRPEQPATSGRSPPRARRSWQPRRRRFGPAEGVGSVACGLHRIEVAVAGIPSSAAVAMRC